MTVRTIKIYSPQGQFVLVLLAALVDLSDRIPSKHEVESHVQKAGYLKLAPELLKQAYDSKAEPKWKTLLAYARQYAVARGLLKPLAVINAWEISDEGRQRLEKFEQQFREGKFDRTKFEFLSDAFLRRIGAP
jgi:hypothetical protein